jgi:hypothetical protein
VLGGNGCASAPVSILEKLEVEAVQELHQYRCRFMILS